MNPFAVPMAFGLAGQLLSELSENETKRKTAGAARGYAAIRTAGITDAVVCPGVDLDAFKANCRAHVFRDMWNHWKLLRTSADGITLDKLDTAAKAFMSLVSQELKGKIRHVEVAIGKLANPWNTPLLESRNGVCMTPMTLRASDYAPAYYEVFVRFVYRGVEDTITWPVRKVGIAGAASQAIGVHCPAGADWMLDAVYTPSQDAVPKASSDPILPPHLSDYSDAFKPGNWDPSTQLLVGGAVLLGVAVLGGYAVRSFR